jgi:hypothetical protein
MRIVQTSVRPPRIWQLIPFPNHGISSLGQFYQTFSSCWDAPFLQVMLISMHISQL